MTQNTASDIEGLPDWVWETHPNLAHIRDAALSRETDPAALLATCLVRLNVLGGPGLLMDIGKGPVTGAGYVAVVSPPGGGKSQVFNAVDELLPVPANLVEIPIALESETMTVSDAGGETGYVRATPNNGSALMRMLSVQALDDDAITPDGSPAHVTLAVKRAEVFTPEGDQVLGMIEAGGKHNGQAVPLETAFLLAFLSEGMSNFTAGKDFRARVDALSYALGVSLGCQDEVAASLLAKKGKGLAQRFLYFVLPVRNAPEALMDIAEDLLAARNPSAEQLLALEEYEAQLGELPPFPGTLTSVVNHAVELSKRPTSVLDMDESVRLFLRRLGLAVAASNGISREDPYAVHLVLQRMFMMKGLMLLMGETTVSATAWKVAAELDRLSARSTKALIEQGVQEVEAKAARELRQQKARARAIKEDVRTPEVVREEILRSAGIVLARKASLLFRDGREYVTPDDLRQAVSKGSVTDWIGCGGSESDSFTVVRRELVKHALEWAVKDGRLSDVSVGKRSRYGARAS